MGLVDRFALGCGYGSAIVEELGSRIVDYCIWLLALSCTMAQKTSAGYGCSGGWS